MNSEHYGLRVDGKRIVIAITSESTLQRIFANFIEVGAVELGPSAWLIDDSIPIEKLHAVIGDLGDGEMVYYFANGSDRMKSGFFASKKLEEDNIIKSSN